MLFCKEAISPIEIRSILWIYPTKFHSFFFLKLITYMYVYVYVYINLQYTWLMLIHFSEALLEINWKSIAALAIYSISQRSYDNISLMKTGFISPQRCLGDAINHKCGKCAKYKLSSSEQAFSFWLWQARDKRTFASSYVFPRNRPNLHFLNQDKTWNAIMCQSVLFLKKK